MQSTTFLLKKITKDYPQFIFKPSDCFKWSHCDKTIYYNVVENNFNISLVHELSHALLGHKEYLKDIQLLNMEAEAWKKSKELASHYKLIIDDDTVQINLDSYRDWIHKRSLCINCNATGIQTKNNEYKCLLCNQSWKVNEAKRNRLIRTKI